MVSTSESDAFRGSRRHQVERLVSRNPRVLPSSLDGVSDSEKRDARKEQQGFADPLAAVDGV
jgi:hypothetical protein